MNKVIYPDDANLIDISSVTIEDRAREDLGDIPELAESIQKLGQITPILLTDDFKLVAGERRIRALQNLGADQVAYVTRGQITEAEEREIELHENMHRKAMKWQEEIMCIADAHEKRRHNNHLKGEAWYAADTAKVFGMSRARVQNALALAKALIDDEQNGLDELWKTTKISEALKLLTERREKLASHARAQMCGTKTLVTEDPSAPKKRTASEVVTFIDPESGEATEQQPIRPVPAVTAPILATEFDLGSMFYKGDCLQVIKDHIKPGSIDHIICDPPYGIGVENFEVQGADSVEETHGKEYFLSLMKNFFPLAWTTLGTSGGYMIMFYDLDHHNFLLDLGKATGFKVVHWPLVWHKKQTCQNNAAQFNPTKTTEYAMVFRRGAEVTLQKPWTSNVFECDGSIEARAYSHPFIKPSALWTWILEHVATPGQTVLDPFAGQMSSCRAAINFGLNPIGIEYDEYHFQQGVQYMINLLNEVSGGHAIFNNNPLAKDGSED